MRQILPFGHKRLAAIEAEQDAQIEEILTRALAEPPFLDRERNSVSAHLDELRGDVIRIEAAIAEHEQEAARLREERAERELAISAHEAAEAVLAQSERREAAE